MTPRRVLTWTLRLGLIGLFGYAGIAKLLDLQQFFLDVHHFELTSWNISVLVAMFLPWLEIVIALALLVRRLEQGALFLSGLLCLVFIAAISSAWYRNLDLSCGCFGHENNPTNYPLHLALNGGMLAAAVVLAVLDRARPSH